MGMPQKMWISHIKFRNVNESKGDKGNEKDFIRYHASSYVHGMGGH